MIIRDFRTHHSNIANEIELVKPKVDNLETAIKSQLKRLEEMIKISEESLEDNK